MRRKKKKKAKAKGLTFFLPLPLSLSHQQVGDELLSVNNYDFQGVLHDEAVDILRSAPRLTMKVRYIGKVPSSTAPLSRQSSPYSVAEEGRRSLTNLSASAAAEREMAADGRNVQTRIPSSRCSIRRPTSSVGSVPENGANLGPASQQARARFNSSGSMVHASLKVAHSRPPALVVTDSSDEDLLEGKLHELLDEKERLTFAFYRNEYVTKRMHIGAYVAFVLELLEKRGNSLDAGDRVRKESALLSPPPLSPSAFFPCFPSNIING